MCGEGGERGAERRGKGVAAIWRWPLFALTHPTTPTPHTPQASASPSPPWTKCPPWTSPSTARMKWTPNSTSSKAAAARCCARRWWSWCPTSLCVLWMNPSW